MEEQIVVKKIWKSNDPEKLEVIYAASRENEIRFYLNAEQYVVAREDDNNETISIEYEEEQEQKDDNSENESILTYIKENIKDKEFLKFLAFFLGISLLVHFLLIVSMMAIATLTSSLLIQLAAITFIFSWGLVIFEVSYECKLTSRSLKSKHSAEHMMINFLTSNKRLPKSMKEIKETSRFCTNCGSREKVRGIAENFVQCILTVIIACSIVYLVFPNYKETLLLGMIFFVSYTTSFYVMWSVIHKYKKLKFIITPIENILNYIVQCANTTKKVKDEDLELAYYAAKYWLKVVYPEFYSEDDDIFNESEDS